MLHIFGETWYEREAEVLLYSIICEQGKVALARDAFARLRNFFVADEQMIARLDANLAECEARLGNVEVAKNYAAMAMAAYTRLEKPAERVRVWWSLGYALFQQGDQVEALLILEDVVEEFEALGMRGAAGQVALDIVEIRLVREEWDVADQLARRLVAFFGDDSPVHRTEALARLGEAIRRRDVPETIFGEIRGMLDAGES